MDEKKRTTKKPTLLSIRHRTDITSGQLALAAGVSLRDTYTVEIGGFARTDIAERVLDAFSRLTGTTYTLNDIKLHNVAPVKPERQTRREDNDDWLVL